MKKLIFLGAAMLLLMATGCSHDENNNEPNGAQKQTVQFSFTNEDFGADEALTRATSAAEKPQTIDLGDCEAEISVESEPAVKTRGPLTNANGHYTIRAYQGGTLKGEMKGTFSGGTFTADASSPKSMNLPDGTYDFIAFNDDVVPSGTGLTVARDKAETARMGITTVTITATPATQMVNFTMKHVGARVRVQLLCQKHFPEDITATLEAAGSLDVPTVMSYNPTTQTSTFTNGAVAPNLLRFQNSNGPSFSFSDFGRNYVYHAVCWVNPYSYYLPSTDASKLKLTFTGGTVFWEPLTGGIIPQLSTVLPAMQSNKSYLVTIKLKPSYTYLMSDGTTGKFKDTSFGGGSKTPVAVVADPTARVAIALKNAGNDTQYEWFSSYPYSNNTTVYSSVITGCTDMEGYKWTWEASGTTDGTIKANQQTLYPAFYAAGHYDPGVPVSGTLAGKKWYLAGGGEWMTYVCKNLAFSMNNDYSAYYGAMMNESFTKVGGTKLSEASYVMSTQLEPTPPSIYAWVWDISFSYNMAGAMGSGTSVMSLVRPFIKY